MSLEEDIKNLILNSPELTHLIDARADIKLRERSMEQELTRKQLAFKWQKSVQTIDRMSDEEIKKNGYIRHKRGVGVTFERIDSKEIFNRIKRSK